jgi:siroheme decarboxylase
VTLVIMLTELEKKVIAEIQGDIPVTERPYLAIAEKLGISETLLLATLRDLCGRGVIRRFGATLRHQKSGYRANAMTAWMVPEERVEEVGRIMAGCRGGVALLQAQSGPRLALQPVHDDTRP